MANELDSLKQAGTIILTTFKRDGTPIPTPVSIAFAGERAFFRTYDKAWKTKRIRNNPQVEAAPANIYGKAVGPAVHGEAELLAGNEARVAAKALARRHPLLQGIVVPLAHRAMSYQTMHYELKAPAAWGA